MYCLFNYPERFLVCDERYSNDDAPKDASLNEPCLNDETEKSLWVVLALTAMQINQAEIKLDNYFASTDYDISGKCFVYLSASCA